jgi:hypothetical protein
MTPPVATASPTAGRTKSPAARARRPVAPPRRAATMPRGARRVSGPRAGLGAMRISSAPVVAGGGVLTAPLGLRLARRAAGVPDARFLDRLIRGRVWIVLVGAMLIGLVFLQLSLLSLNAGIGQAMETSQGLERQNAALRTQVSKMDAGQRVQDAASRQGLVMPSAGARHYLKAGVVSPEVAVRGIAAPKAATDLPAATPAMPAATSASAAPAVAAAPTIAPVASAAASTTTTPAPTAATTATPTAMAPAATPATAASVAPTPGRAPVTTTPQG